jgi:hypothetical protein
MPGLQENEIADAFTAGSEPRSDAPPDADAAAHAAVSLNDSMVPGARRSTPVRSLTLFLTAAEIRRPGALTHSLDP